MNIRVREVETGTIRAASEPSDDDFTILAGDDYSGRQLSADDVHLRAMYLCHDQYDRTYERFPKAYLDRFAETLPGKSVLPGHNYKEMPLGRFYKAGTESKMEDIPCPSEGRELPSWWYDYDAAPEPQIIKDIVPYFATQRKRVTFLSAGYYFPNDPSTEGMRAQIDTGCWKWVSIGFRYDDLDCDLCKKSYFDDCPHLLGYLDKEGKVCTGTYSGDPSHAEALEGSIVYLGAQPRARLIKQFSEGAMDPQAAALTPLGLDLVVFKEAEALARLHGHRQKAWHFDWTGKSSVEGNACLDKPGAAGERVSAFGVPPSGALGGKTTPKPKADEKRFFTEADILGIAEALENGQTVEEYLQQISDSTDAAPAGRTFESRLTAALGAVAGITQDASELQALRLEKGKSISSARRSQMIEIHQELGDLIQATRPKAEELRALELQLLRLDAQTLPDFPS